MLRQIKFFFQRLFSMSIYHKYNIIDESSIWSLDTEIARFILPRLKLFKKTNVTDKPTSKELDKMILSFERIANQFKETEELILIKQISNQSLREKAFKKYYKEIDEGLILFAKKFKSLWW